MQKISQRDIFWSLIENLTDKADIRSMLFFFQKEICSVVENSDYVKHSLKQGPKLLAVKFLAIDPAVMYPKAELFFSL